MQRLSEAERPGFKPLPWVWQPEDDQQEAGPTPPPGLEAAGAVWLEERRRGKTWHVGTAPQTSLISPASLGGGGPSGPSTVWPGSSRRLKRVSMGE